MAKKKVRSKKPVARKAPARKKKTPSSPPSKPNTMLNGWITHTEFASTDPDATQVWLEKVLGWKFRPSFPMPDGSQYLLFMYSDKGGGGIRVAGSNDDACTVPYVQVKSVRAAFDRAIRAGADEMIAPDAIMDDLWIACVRAPGGIAIGFAGPK